LGKYWFVFAAFSGLVLDFDFILELIQNFFGFNNFFLTHGGIIHSLGFVLLLGMISTIIYYKNREYGKYGFILSAGCFVHLILDFVLGGGQYSLMLLYPFVETQFRLHLLEPYTLLNIYEILDAVLIMCALATLFYLQRKKKSRLI